VKNVYVAWWLSFWSKIALFPLFATLPDWLIKNEQYSTGLKGLSLILFNKRFHTTWEYVICMRKDNISHICISTALKAFNTDNSTDWLHFSTCRYWSQTRRWIVAKNHKLKSLFTLYTVQINGVKGGNSNQTGHFITNSHLWWRHEIIAPILQEGIFQAPKMEFFASFQFEIEKITRYSFSRDLLTCVQNKLYFWIDMTLS